MKKLIALGLLVVVLAVTAFWMNKRGNQYIELTLLQAQHGLDTSHYGENRAFEAIARYFPQKSTAKTELEAIKKRYLAAKESEEQLAQVEQAVRDVRKRIDQRPTTEELSARQKDRAVYAMNELESAARMRSTDYRNLREAKRRAEQGGFRTMVELWSTDFSKRWNGLFGTPS